MSLDLGHGHRQTNGPQPIFLNKVLLAPSHTPFVPVLWRLRHLLPGPLQSKFTNSELQQSTWGQGDDLRPARTSLLPPTHTSAACICVQARASHHSTCSSACTRHVGLSNTQSGAHTHICPILSLSMAPSGTMPGTQWSPVERRQRLEGRTQFLQEDQQQ